MSSLDDLDFDNLDEFTDERYAEVDPNIYASLGDVILYNQKRDRFEVIESGRSYELTETESNFILMGIVIRQNEDLTVDVLMSRFLMKDRKTWSDEYMHSKTNALRGYIFALYKRFITAFKNKLPDYPRLKNMEISILSVNDIYEISKDINFVFKKYKELIDDDTYEKFIKRLFRDNHIMCKTQDKIYTVHFDLETEPIFTIELPKWYMWFDYMCVFRNLQVSGYTNYDEDSDEYLISQI